MIPSLQAEMSIWAGKRRSQRHRESSSPAVSVVGEFSYSLEVAMNRPFLFLGIIATTALAISLCGDLGYNDLKNDLLQLSADIGVLSNGPMDPGPASQTREPPSIDIDQWLRRATTSGIAPADADQARKEFTEFLACGGRTTPGPHGPSFRRKRPGSMASVPSLGTEFFMRPRPLCGLALNQAAQTGPVVVEAGMFELISLSLRLHVKTDESRSPYSVAMTRHRDRTGHVNAGLRAHTCDRIFHTPTTPPEAQLTFWSVVTSDLSPWSRPLSGGGVGRVAAAGELNYAERLAQGRPIGSGLIEGGLQELRGRRETNRRPWLTPNPNQMATVGS